MTVIVKDVVARASGGDPLEYVMSDGTVDRYGDIVEAKGWQLGNFKRNPIALFGHDKDFIIGHWTNVRVVGDKLLGRLELLKAGVSERLDEIRAAVEAGVLRAVSVGFRAIEREPIDKTGGYRFTKSELVECSLVAIPANPNALQVMRALNLSDDAVRTVLGETANKDIALQRRSTGETAVSSPNHFIRKGQKMPSLAEKVEFAEKRLVALRDQLSEIVAKDDLDESDTAQMEELNGLIDTQQKSVEQLKAAEQRLAVASVVEKTVPVTVDSRRPFAAPAEKIKPADYIIRSIAIKLVAHQQKKSLDEVRYERYGDDECTKTVLDYTQKAASAVATTSTSGWASQLVQTAVSDFTETLMPASVYPGLSARGLRLTFGRNGVISIPVRSATPTIAGSFVLEGNPIPVRQGAFSSVTLTPKKMAVISAFTREIAEHSTPAIEGLIRDAIQEDTSVALDTVLLDATAASTTRPAGLRNGVTETTATAGANFTALVTDIKNLIGALTTGSNGNIRNPVWIMNPAQALSLSLTQNAGGDFPFAAEINQNRLMGYPVIVSSTVTAAMVILVDAADFVSVTGDAPRFDVSDQATLHMEDTTPLAIGTTGTPNTVAAPVRSLFQTDSLALRMIMPMNWAMRRSGVVAWTSSVTW